MLAEQHPGRAGLKEPSAKASFAAAAGTDLGAKTRHAAGRSRSHEGPVLGPVEHDVGSEQ